MSARGPQAQADQLTVTARHAEALGFYAIEMSDHVVIPSKIDSVYPYTPDGRVPQWDDWNEQLTTLTFLAGKTTSIRLLTSVMVLPYRNPLLAAKMLSTLDLLSKGRLIVGVGAGWMREEFEALGAPPYEDRAKVAEEYIRFFKSVWTEEPPSFHGKYFGLKSKVKFLPKPVQKPHPPIWVGGESPGAMRRAASLGDAWFPIGSNPRYPLKTLGQLSAATRRLKRYTTEAGRKKGEVGLSFVAPFKGQGKGSRNSESELFVGDTQKIISDVKACEKLGFSYVKLDLSGAALEQTLENMSVFSEKVLRHLS